MKKIKILNQNQLYILTFFSLIFIFFQYIPNTSYGQTFSNTTATACGANLNGIGQNIAVSGLPAGGLTSGGIVLQQVNVQLGNASCKANLSSYQLELRSPNGVTIWIANGLGASASSRWINTKFRDDAALDRIKDFTNTVQGAYHPYSIGYYRIETAGQFSNFNDGSNPNGNWTFTVFESTTSEVTFEKVELIFGPRLSIIDVTSCINNDNCTGASCLTNGLYRGNNFNGYTSPDPLYPGNTVGACSWNGANNRSAWYRFFPTSTTAKITISGMISSPTGGDDMQPIILKAPNPDDCSTPPSVVPNGGCPDDESVNNRAYLSSNGGGIVTAGNVYVNGITANCEFNLSSLTIGDPYFLYLDGNGNASSDFYIEVESGVSGSCSSCASCVPPASPSASVTSQPSCSVNTATIVVTAPLGATLEYSIDGINYQSSPTFNNVSPGASYNVTVRDNSTPTCISSPTTLTVNAQPSTPSAPLVGTITQPNCSTATGSVILNGLPASGTWTLNPGSITGTGTTDTISGLSAGTYSYTVTNSEGCTSVASANVVINAQPVTPVINSNASIDTAFCGYANGAIKNINITGGTRPYTYQWFTNNTLVSSDSVLNNAIAGNYTLIVESQQGCRDTSIVFSIPAVNGITVSLSGDPLSGQEPLNSVAIANTSISAVDYKWELNDNLLPNETDSILNLTQLAEGTYVTEVIVTDKNNCVDTASITIVVEGIVSIYIPNVFTPNLDGNNDLFIITQKGYKDLNLEIYNRWGLLIWEINALSPNWDGRTSAGGLASEGTYFYILKTTDKKDEVKTYKGSFLLSR